jgi:hypothetical protein
LDREKKHIWPPMNADNPEVLRSGGSSGVAGITTFMSRTLLSQKDVPIHSVAIRAAMRGHEEVRNYSLRQGAKPWTVHCDVDARGIRLEALDSGSGWESAADILYRHRAQEFSALSLNYRISSSLRLAATAMILDVFA